MARSAMAAFSTVGCLRSGMGRVAVRDASHVEHIERVRQLALQLAPLVAPPLVAPLHRGASARRCCWMRSASHCKRVIYEEKHSVKWIKNRATAVFISSALIFLSSCFCARCGSKTTEREGAAAAHLAKCV